MNQFGHFAFSCLALLIGLLLAWPRLRRMGFRYVDIIDGAFYLAFGAFGGGWAANAIPRIVDNLLGGGHYVPWWAASIHWMGVVAGGSIVGYLWTRWRGRPVGECFDAFAPLLPIGLAVARIGCYVNADAYGRPTDSWIAMWLPDVTGFYAWRYPTQMVSMGMNLLLAALLFGIEAYRSRSGRPRHWPFPGFLFLLYLELYCLGRFYFEFWRDDMYPWIGPLTYSHLYCLIGIAFATWGIGRGLLTARRSPVLAR